MKKQFRKHRFILILTWILLLSLISSSKAQDRAFARGILDTLTSAGMHGRGYVANGCGIASEFIRGEFMKLGLKPPDGNYFQEFTMPVNTFPDTVRVWIDGKELTPGADFVIRSSSPDVKGTFDLLWFLKDSTGIPSPREEYGMIDISSKVLVTDMTFKEFEGSNFAAAGIIFLTDGKVGWHVSDAGNVNNFFSLIISKQAIPDNADSIKIDANAKFYPEYRVRNVIGVIPGLNDSSGAVVIGAHYDHLGRMGSKVYFPGANDNASGVAFILDLAGHFSQPGNKPARTLVFVAFAGEETGLKGSSYFVNNNPIPLDSIRFMLNFDMVGSGSEGIKVVNGSVFHQEFDELVRINDEKAYLPSVNERGEAANSDHYPFYREGVPCFFIYTLGKECMEYHNPDDTTENTPFTKYEGLFRLVTDFIQTL